MIYDPEQRTIVIFANGVVSDMARLRPYLRPDTLIICADGGLRYAHELGVRPHVIIGDMDSVEPDLMQAMSESGIEIIRHPVNKKQTDLELALQLAVTKQPQQIILMGALGGRLDQMLANIMVMARAEYAGIYMTIVEANQTATLLRGQESLTLRGQIGDTLSLIPLTETVTGVTLEPAAWPLYNETLTLGSTWTMSNKFTAPTLTVQIETGLVLVVHLSN